MNAHLIHPASLGQQPNGSNLVAAQTEEQKDDGNPKSRYLKLFSKNKCNGMEQLRVHSEDLHILKVAPLFSDSVHFHIEKSCNVNSKPLTQYGVLGMVKGDEAAKDSQTQQNLLFSNTEEPWSAFICGSQGSGKSHTLSCLLENALLCDTEIGTLKAPLTGLVFHYDKFANFGRGQACEAAYLCAASSNGGVPVQVLVAPTSLKRMAYQYHNLPGLPEGCERPKVLPLYFSQQQLSVDTMMTLMAVNDDETSAPLYISALCQLLRDIAMDNQGTPGFDYRDFRNRLACLALTDGQNGPLSLRLQLLQSFLLEEEQTSASRAAFADTWTFRPGTLTIIDLSDQFVNETDACALFSICLKLFMADWQSNPRIIALDEAHKFLTSSTEATKLTSDLISVIRQQRHMSARVVVATQEPTISKALLDLCNVSIIHRFNSPKWFRTLEEHLAGACIDKKERDAMFRDIVKLSTGEALVFCPTAVLDLESGRPVSLQDGVVKIVVRDLVSADGGQSVQASSREYAERSQSLPVMPEYQRFKGDRMPAPGSLAKKVGAKASANLLNNSGSANLASSTVRSTVHTVPASQEPRNPSAARGPTSRNEDSDDDTDDAETGESTSTYPNSDSESDDQSAVATRFKQVTLASGGSELQHKPAKTIIVISKKKLPVGHKYKATGISEEELI